MFSLNHYKKAFHSLPLPTLPKLLKTTETQPNKIPYSHPKPTKPSPNFPKRPKPGPPKAQHWPNQATKMVQTYPQTKSFRLVIFFSFPETFVDGRMGHQRPQHGPNINFKRPPKTPRNHPIFSIFSVFLIFCFFYFSDFFCFFFFIFYFSRLFFFFDFFDFFDFFSFF